MEPQLSSTGKNVTKFAQSPMCSDNLTLSRTKNGLFNTWTSNHRKIPRSKESIDFLGTCAKTSSFQNG
jgi:hypothetical protein